MDYIQLDFNGPRLTTVTLPTVQTAEKKFYPGATGYRDALCDQIGKVVRSTRVAEGVSACVEFDDGSIVAVSLRPEDYTTAEAIILTKGKETWVA